MSPDSKVHGANMGPIWGRQDPGANMGPIWDRQDPGGPYVGPMNFAIWVVLYFLTLLTGNIRPNDQSIICLKPKFHNNPMQII